MINFVYTAKDSKNCKGFKILKILFFKKPADDYRVTFAIEMKKGKLKYLFGVLLVALFLGPQLYKTFHIFTDHHGHLSCEAMKSPDSGLNGENNHCPICAFHFTTFDEAVRYHVQVELISLPVHHLEHEDFYHPNQTAYSFQLRAPPIQPELI